MSDKPIEIEFDNKEVHEKLLDLAKKTENLRPLMKNIAGIFAYSTEENFKEEKTYLLYMSDNGTKEPEDDVILEVE